MTKTVSSIATREGLNYCTTRRQTAGQEARNRDKNDTNKSAVNLSHTQQNGIKIKRIFNSHNPPQLSPKAGWTETQIWQNAWRVSG